MRGSRFLLGFSYSAAVLAGTASRAANFQGLGSLDLNAIGSNAKGVSSDGRYIVGVSNSEAFRWSAETGMVGLGYLGGGENGFSIANDVSDDGQRIVGLSGANNFGVRPTLWDYGVGPTDLMPTPEPRFLDGEATAITGDGLTVVGYSGGPDPKAFRWTDVTGTVEITDPSGEWEDTQAHAVSADGLTFAGRGKPTTLYIHAFTWSTDTSFQSLTPGETVWLEANAMSPDGSTIVGDNQATNSYEAFRWTASGGYQGLGKLFEDELASAQAHGVSDDGATIVGHHAPQPNSFNTNTPFVWTEALGMKSLREILEDQGLTGALAGWELWTASDVSADGRTIVGRGVNPDGNLEAYVATLDAIALLAGDYNHSGQVEQGDLDLVLQNWGVDTDTVGVPPGWINDLPSGQIEQAELDGVLQNWGDTASPDSGGSILSSVPEPGVSGLGAFLLLRVRTRRTRS